MIVLSTCLNIWAATWDFQQCGILTWIDSGEPLPPPFELRNSKCCSVRVAYSQRIFKRPAKALTWLCICAGWSEPLHVAHTTLLEISCRGSIMLLVLKRYLDALQSRLIETVLLSTHKICFNWVIRILILCYALFIKCLSTDSLAEVSVVCLIWFDNFSVMSGQIFLCWTNIKQGLMWLAQGHNPVTQMRLEPAIGQSRDMHSTTEQLRSQKFLVRMCRCTYRHV